MNFRDPFFYVRMRESVSISRPASMGLAMWAFMPARMAFYLSSSKALAVIATMGTLGASLGSVRIWRVAA